jgi:hypothetical protein
MHNRRRPDKTTAPRSAPPHGTRGGADSVKNLLQRASSPLKQIGAQVARNQALREWLAGQLPSELVPHLTGVAAHDSELVILADSASWGVRLRYEAVNLRAALERDHPGFARITVRVVPGAKP